MIKVTESGNRKSYCVEFEGRADVLAEQYAALTAELTIKAPDVLKASMQIIQEVIDNG